MAVPLVQITNPNGRKGWVPATHPRLHLFGRPPSTRHPRGDVPPKRNASLSVWRSYAASQGLPGDEAEQKSGQAFGDLFHGAPRKIDAPNLAEAVITTKTKNEFDYSNAKS